MEFETTFPPQRVAQSSVSKLMFTVLLALVPGALTMLWYFGFGVAMNLLLAISVALLAEGVLLLMRRRPVMLFLTDGSAILTAVLLALALPALVPGWVVVVGILFAIIIAKHLYGGLGYNPFNPAMAGYVFLLVSFPRQMTAWMPPENISQLALSFADVLQIKFQERLPAGVGFDAVTMATPLDTVKTQLGLSQTLSEIYPLPVFGWLAGHGWQWVSIAYLLGGIWLLYKQAITWQIPCGFLLALSTLSLIFYCFDWQRSPSPVFHLFSGATMLGAFFIATDPVTASTTPKGRLIYGALMGFFVYIIRTWGSFPDAVAFAVLLMNMAAPTIDYYTRPRLSGHE